MAWGKTEDQKQAARDEKERAKYLASPVGQAEQAKNRGDTFFQVAISVADVNGYSNLAWGAGDVSKTRRNDAAGLLGEIEALGWRLEHVGFVFVETGSSSRSKVMASGEMSSTSGRVEGIYLFRSL